MKETEDEDNDTGGSTDIAFPAGDHRRDWRDQPERFATREQRWPGKEATGRDRRSGRISTRSWGPLAALGAASHGRESG